MACAVLHVEGERLRSPPPGVDARHALAEADRLWPYAIVRSLLPIHPGPCELPDPAILAQMRRSQEGLRLAGLRDHADEDADFGLLETGELRVDLTRRTPTSVPGATTICASELADLITRQTPTLIDVALGSWGQSLPSAVGLQGTGLGARFSDVRQTRLRRKIQDLTSGDLAAAIVVFGTKSERLIGTTYRLQSGAASCGAWLHSGALVSRRLRRVAGERSTGG